MDKIKYKNVVCFYYGNRSEICTYFEPIPILENKTENNTRSATSKTKKNNNKKGSKNNV